jgi:hypothetical protein
MTICESSPHNGTLLDVIGSARAWGDFNFVPATIEPNGNSYFIECKFEHYVTASVLKPDLAELVERRQDAIWVASRIIAEFGVNPLIQDQEKTTINIGFAAVSRSRSELPATLFYCTDYRFRTGLAFGNYEPTSNIRNEIAQAFWDLLLKHADNTADFEATYVAATWVATFGCRGGVFEYREEPI